MAQSTATPVAIGVFKYLTLGPCVSGRELYNLVTVNRSESHFRQFSEWFRAYADKIGLVDGKDYARTSVLLPERSTRQQIEFYVTVEAAIKIARIQQAKRGMGVVAFLEAPHGVEDLLGGGCSSIAPADTPAQLQSRYRTEQPATTAQALELPLQATNAPETTATTPETVKAPETPVLSPAQQLLQQAQQLVEAEEARAKAEKEKPAVPAEELTAMIGRLDTVEKRLNVVLYFFQQASHALRTLQPVGLPSAADELTGQLPLEPPTRAKINRLINAYAAAKDLPEQRVWKQVYGHLVSRNIFDPWLYTHGQKDPNYLDIVEEHGQLENLYTVAKEVLLIK